jgi:flavin reductase (DIM6/NTAB) family NADH-FMN oxidoreductase RutF
MNHDPIPECANALAQIPGGLFILTSHFDTQRGGVLVRWVQQCSDVPPMVMVALCKGQPVEMLIRDCHYFTLCQISADDRFLIRKFIGHNGFHSNGNHIEHECSPLSGQFESNGSHRSDEDEDALLPLMTRAAPSGCPIVDRALSYLDCEVVRHVELDSDHRIYVGQVHTGGVLNHGTPAVHFGLRGMTG